MEKPIAVLFDIDGTLITTGGAGARSWRWAFNELHGVAADIGQFSEAGMTDPEVARRTFANIIGHERPWIDGEMGMCDACPKDENHSLDRQLLKASMQAYSSSVQLDWDSPRINLNRVK